jgi:hypothetical protein
MASINILSIKHGHVSVSLKMKNELGLMLITEIIKKFTLKIPWTQDPVLGIPVFFFKQWQDGGN